MHIRSSLAAPASSSFLSIPTSATTAWARYRNKGKNGGRIPSWGAPFPVEVGAAGWTCTDGWTHTHNFCRSFQLCTLISLEMKFLNHTGISDHVPGKTGASQGRSACPRECCCVPAQTPAMPMAMDGGGSQGPHSDRAGAAAGLGFQGGFIAKTLMSNKKVLLSLAGRKEGREQRG